MNPDPSSLRALPLFAELSDEQIQALLSAFSPLSCQPGEKLLEAGSTADRVLLLLTGAVSVRNGEEEVLSVTGPTTLGELGALTGEMRVLDVVVSEKAELLAAPLPAFEKLLAERGDLGFLFQRNLLRLAARKIGRDRRRSAEMRENIISTQKAMKMMRDALLESEDNPLHAALFEQLDALIENNRKIHYLVEPSRLVPTHLRLEGGALHRVTALSNEWIYLDNPPAQLEEKKEITAVLVLDKDEFPISGQVERVSRGEAVIFLDELIAPYEALLSRHLSRAQLLDVMF